jgi:sortase A
LVAALVVAAYYAWLLWGTGLTTSRAQSDLRSQITGEINQQDPTVAGRPPVGASHGGSSAPALIVPAPKEGTALAIIKIAKIHLDMVVVNGTSTVDLRKGPGHYIGTAYPWEAHGAAAIAGHRTTYLHPFWSLDKLTPGDLIRLVTPYGTFEYHVTRSIVITPDERWVLRQTGKPTLVLTTCTPRFSASHRLVVFADRAP